MKVRAMKRLASKSTSFDRKGVFTSSIVQKQALHMQHILCNHSRHSTCQPIPTLTTPPLNTTKRYFHRSITGGGMTTHVTPQQADSTHSTGKQVFMCYSNRTALSAGASSTSLGLSPHHSTRPKNKRPKVISTHRNY